MKEINGEKELLLAMKKKGFGEGRWNGVGGKFDSENDKNILATAKRELKEEIDVIAQKIKKVAILSFYFPYQKDWDQNVHVFFVENWQGEPRETEEVRPKWFKINEIPFDQMWPDDRFWLPRILNGEKLKAKFVFKLPSCSEGERRESVLFDQGEVIKSFEIKNI